MSRPHLVIFLYRLLRGKKYRQSRARVFDPAHPPQPLRWRPKIKIYGFVTGLIGGLGAMILVAQYGIEPLTSRALSTRGIAGALLSGLIVPSAVFALVAWRFNRKLRRGPSAPPLRRAPAATAAACVWLGAVLLGAALAAPGHAYVNGPCSATFAGVDTAGLETGTSSDAIAVPEDGTVVYTMTAPEGLQSWRFVLKYGPYEEVVDQGVAKPPRPGDANLGLRFEGLLGDAVVDESGNTVSGSAAIADYAWLGAGLYELQGTVVTKAGATCDGALLIDVQGNPLTTVIGGAAAAATLVGAVGIGLVTIGGLRDGGELLDALDRFEGDDPAVGADDEIPEWRREELAAQERFDREVMGEAEADWAQRRPAWEAALATADAAMLAEIRADRARLADAETYLERRERIEERLRAGEVAQGEHDEWGEWWSSVRDDAFDGMLRDVDSLPAFVEDAGSATRQAIGETWDAVSDPENWRTVAETVAETGYDASGLMAGGAWGDGVDNAAESFGDAAELGSRLVQAAVNDPVGFVKQLTPLGDFEAAIDPELSLGQRLTRLGTGLVDVGLTLAGGATLQGAEALDDLSDAARVARAVGDDAFDARRAAWAEARRAATEHVDAFARAVETGEDARLAALRVQSNKQALIGMKGQTDGVKAAFNEQMRGIYDRTDAAVLDRARVHIDTTILPEGQRLGTLRPASTDELADYLARDPKAAYRQTSGRVTVLSDGQGNIVELFEPTNPKPGITVGSDRDFTMYVRPAGADGAWSLPHDDVADWYRDGFVEAVGRDNLDALGIAPEDALRRFDQAVTSDVHPEAYTNVGRVIGRPGAALDDVQQVGLTIGYKADHAFVHAEQLRAAGNLAAAEDWMADGARQVTKQWDAQVGERVKAITAQVDELKAAGALPGDFIVKPPPPRLQSAIDVMRQVQTEGLSPVEMEHALRALGMTPSDVARDVGSYYESLQKLAPSPLTTLQQNLVASGGTS